MNNLLIFGLGYTASRIKAAHEQRGRDAEADDVGERIKLASERTVSAAEAGEAAGRNTLLGGAVLLAAIAGNALSGKRRKPPPISP